jgi:hypothetical protein
MDCPDFSKWLENRDSYDVSEADKALKHAAHCRTCTAKLRVDEQLDRLIYKAMQSIDMPEMLPRRVDISFDRMSKTPSRRKYGSKYGLYGAFSAIMAVMAVFFLSSTFSPSIASMDELGRHVIADHLHHDDSVLEVADPQKLNRLGDFDLSYETVRNAMPEGYSFVGARICPLGECESVHLVFLLNGKRVSLFVVKIEDVGFSPAEDRQYSLREGTRTVDFWKDGRYIYAMVV